MTYRDDNDALHVRVEHLESELSEARATIARLEGKTTAPAVPAKESWAMSAPSSLLLERELPFRTSTQGLVAIGDHLRAQIGIGGQVTQTGDGVTYRVGTLEASLVPTGDQSSRLRLFVDQQGYAMLPPLLGPMLGPLAVLPFLLVTDALGPLAAFGAVVAAVLISFFAFRVLVGRYVRHHQTRFAAAFESVAAIAQQHASSRVRVAPAEVQGQVRTPEAVEETEDASEVASRMRG